MDVALGGGAAQLAAFLDEPDAGVRRFQQAGAVADGQVQHFALVEVDRQRLGDLTQGPFALPLEVRRGIQAGGLERGRDLRCQQQQHPLLVRLEHAPLGVEAHDQGADGPVAHHQRHGLDRLEAARHSPGDRVVPVRVVLHDDRSALLDRQSGSALTRSQRRVVERLAWIVAVGGHQQARGVVPQIQRDRVTVEQLTGTLGDQLGQLTRVERVAGRDRQVIQRPQQTRVDLGRIVRSSAWHRSQVCENLPAPYARCVTSQRDRRLIPLIAYRYAPDQLAGVVAILLFFVALLLGAALAVFIRSFH